MRCERCGRPINAATEAIKKGSTTYTYGPKCARIAGLIDTPLRMARRTAQGRPMADDPRQLALELVA